MVPNPRDMNAGVRDRIRAWLKFYKRTRGWTNERLAQELDLAEPTVTNAMNGGSVGLDFLVKMHLRLHRSADDLIGMDPPSK